MSPPDEAEKFATELTYIYDHYRTAALNRAYYGVRLTAYQRYNFWMEIAIAIGAAGSGGIAGLAIWSDTRMGSHAWPWIAGIATVLSVIKPVLQLGKSIEEYTKLYAAHTSNYLELKSIVEDIHTNKSISEKVRDRYGVSRQLMKELGGHDDPNPSKKLIGRLQVAVNKKIPSASLWMPGDDEKPPS